MDTSSGWQPYQHVEFPDHPPAVFFNDIPLPLATSDWEAITGVPSAPPPTSFRWPSPSKLPELVELKIETDITPLRINVISLSSIGKNGIPTAREELWTCGRLGNDKCPFQKTATGAHVLPVPSHLFSQETAKWYTVQIFWDVPYPARHERYVDRASCTAVWMFARA